MGDDSLRREAAGAAAAAPAAPAAMTRAAWLGRAVAAVAAWEQRFGGPVGHHALDVDPDRLEQAWDEFTVRMEANFPFFHPRFAGQMLKPPHPVSVAGYPSRSGHLRLHRHPELDIVTYFPYRPGATAQDITTASQRMLRAGMQEPGDPIWLSTLKVDAADFAACHRDLDVDLDLHRAPGIPGSGPAVGPGSDPAVGPGSDPAVGPALQPAHRGRPSPPGGPGTTVTVVRSVLLKPEHEAWVDRLHARLVTLATDAFEEDPRT